jgi:hypothetical protein
MSRTLTYTTAARLNTAVTPIFGYVQSEADGLYEHDVYVPAGGLVAVPVFIRPSRIQLLYAESSRPMSVLTGGANEVQQISVVSAAVGSLKVIVRFNGVDSGNIRMDASAASIQATLEAMSTIGTGNVVVTGGPIETTPATVTFVGALGLANQNAMTFTLVDGGITTPLITTITNGVSGSSIFSTKAGRQLLWHPRHHAPCPFTTDRDTISIQNSTSRDGTFHLKYHYDSRN